MKAIKCIVCGIIFFLSSPLLAENQQFIHGRHAIRLGWGDAAISAALYDFRSLYGMTLEPIYGDSGNPLDLIQGMPAPEADQILRDFCLVEKGKMYTTGHFFLGYRYQLIPLISIGLELDVLSMSRINQTYNGYHVYLESWKESILHITVMPNIRFAYFRRPLIELYSALGVGCSYYDWGYPGVVMNATFLGLNVGNEHFFAEAELGSLQSWHFGAIPQGLYGSRLFSIAVGYRF